MARAMVKLHALRRLLADRSGNAAMVVGLALFPMIGAAGLAIDTVLAYTTENQLQKALDAAALAAGRTLQDENVEADARAFFDANFREANGLANVADFDIDISADQTLVTLTASATMPTRFMRLFGEDEVTVQGRTVVARQTTGLELALVLDITGSMLDDNKIGSLKTAASDLLTILYGNRNTVPDLWISVVPYIGAVNIGTGNIGFLSNTDPARNGAAPFGPAGWGGCVLARGSGRDQTDDPPSVARFSSYLYPDTPSAPSTQVFYGTEFYRNDWGTNRNPQHRTFVNNWSGGVQYWDGYGPNVGCPAAITPLTGNRGTVTSAIATLRP